MKTTAAANANIAVIKYWGRRNEELILPNNNSISFTMDSQLETLTTVEFSEKLKRDELDIDGKTATEKELKRASKFLDVVRKMAGKKMFAKIDSINTFPKAAGLASSASSFAAMAAAASKAIGIRLNEKELSALARRGSGSASRSIYGGAVEWLAGVKDDGSDCYAVPLASYEKWKDLRNVIAITNSHEKKVSSTDGMKITTRTSPLYPARLSSVEKRLAVVREAIKENDFEMMAPAIMQESNNMHAVMLDSTPPVIYLNSTSFKIIEKVIELNDSYGRPVAAYTFDAGPNAHIYTTKKYEKEVSEILEHMNGIEKIMVCKVGEGVRYLEKHLF
ncbi:diphosphomevalonate decarboxylase [Candidatus Micrarchaeota archaeon]|nr:diphosphomevalonate decarboxylase [Candidatus Micrarchaeota archaeon]